MNEPRTANLLGALAFIVSDDLKWTTEEVASRGASGFGDHHYYSGRMIEAYARVLGLSHSCTVRLMDHPEEDG